MSLRLEWANLLTSGFHLLLLFAGFRINTPGGWAFVLALVAAISLAAWVGNFRRYRLIGDTPTSRIASAAQGYVELLGNAAQHPGQALFSRLTGLPCVWFRFSIEKKSGNKWQHVESGRSDATFLLRDDSGECTVDPEGAEILTSHKSTWTEKNRHRYTEWLLLAGDPFYALGEFSTLGAAELPTAGETARALLADWKKDPARLKARFDLDGDGQIDLREWDLARRAARREAERQTREHLARDLSTHLLRRPKDGRMYLLSNLDPEALARRYRLWSWFHMTVFSSGAAAAGYFALRVG